MKNVRLNREEPLPAFSLRDNKNIRLAAKNSELEYNSLKAVYQEHWNYCWWLVILLSSEKLGQNFMNVLLNWYMLCDIIIFLVLFYENIPNKNTIINSINNSIAYSEPEACKKY